MPYTPAWRCLIAHVGGLEASVAAAGWCDVFAPSRVGDEACSGVLNGLLGNGTGYR